MDTDFAAFHDELRAVARDVLGTTDSDTAAEWGLLARSGWLGLEVPEALDGSGATFAEVAVVLEEMGRAAARSPYLGSVALSVGALDLLGPEPGRDDLLRDIASGGVVVALALAGEDDGGAVGALPFRIERAGAGAVLHGRAEFVVDAPEAARLLLPAVDPGVGPVLVVVDPRDTGVTVVPQPVLDETRRLGAVVVDGVVVEEAAVWRFATDPQAARARLSDRAAVAVACDSLGLSAAMLDGTVAYAKVREQFGRPIGSFQAVKHACADMLVQVSVARALVAGAVEQVATDAPDASRAASMAKSYACGAAVTIAGKAMQLHGGIGYTWESGIHVYLKRAALNRSLFGSPAAHRRRLAARHT